MKKRSFFRKVRVISLLLSCALALPLTAISALNSTAVFSPLSLSARAAILIDADSKTVLCEKNARERLGEASTTKIMTALVVSEAMELDRTVSIPYEAVGTEGSSVYLRAGELMSVRDLLYALLLESANDAAVALAILCAGSIEAFADKMNQKADSIGLCDTHFKNPHGLYDEDHYTTAYDLALISAVSLENEELCAIFSTKKATIPLGVTKENPQGEGSRYLHNHNKMLSLYDGAIGVKTGFTKKTGRCLVSAARRDGMTLVAVTLNASNDWHDHCAMLDYGFQNYERAILFDTGEFRYPYAVCGGNEAQVIAINSQPIVLTLPKEREKERVRIEFHQKFEIAPISAGSHLGELTVSANGKSASSPLVAAHSVDRANNKKHKFFWQS